MFEEIKRLLIENANCDPDSITPDALLKEDLGIDSLYAVELILYLEEEFNIKIEWEDIENLKYVSDVVDLVEKKMGEKK